MSAHRQALSSENSQWFPSHPCLKTDEQISDLQTTRKVAFSSSSSDGSSSPSMKSLPLTFRNYFCPAILYNFPPHVFISAADRQIYAQEFVVKCCTGPSQVDKGGEIIEGCIIYAALRGTHSHPVVDCSFIVRGLTLSIAEI